MNKTTRLTQQDLQIYPSQRLTDTPDGGGLMVGTPLTGEDNEVFPPVSDVDRTMGSFDARLLYPGVLRPDSEPLYGAHFIISEPPKAGNVSFLAFKARNYGEKRADIMPRIEAYSVPTVESRMTLLGLHQAGVRMVVAYQRTEAPLPKVGERYCLEMRETTGQKRLVRSQYFRIADLESEIRTFEIVTAGNTVKEIQRRVVKMEIYNPLTDDYEGLKSPVEGHHGSGVSILETQVSDSATYYGVRPVAEAIKEGATSVAVDTVYEKLVPTSTVETAYADEYPVAAEAWVASGAERAVLRTTSPVRGDIWLEHPVIPGTVKIQGWTDDAQGRLTRNGEVVQIDYRRGLIQSFPSVSSLTVNAVPGAVQTAARHSTYIEIKDTNQGTQWAPFLQPAPMRGSLIVSFMALGVWYTLRDNGNGILIDNDGKSAGTVETSGSAVLSLPAMPDVGSNLVFAWAAETAYQTFDGERAGTDSVAQSANAAAHYPAQPVGEIKPGSFSLSWEENGVKKTARDNGKGYLEGDVSGHVWYSGGFASVGTAINAGVVKVAWQKYTDPVVTITEVADFYKTVNFAAGRIAPGSLTLQTDLLLSVQGVKKTRFKINGLHGGGNFESAIYDSVGATIGITVSDNGAGGLMMGGNLLDGASVDYATGRIVLPADSIKVFAFGYHDTVAQISSGAKPINIGGEEYQISNFSASFQGLKAVFRPSESVRAFERVETVPTMSFNVLRGGYAGSRAVENTWVFDADGVKLIERDGRIYKDFDHKTGTGTVVGAVNAQTGKITISDESVDPMKIKITAGIVAKPQLPIDNYVGRAPAAPMKPESFTVYCKDTDEEGQERVLVGRSGSDGEITGDFSGNINYETGFFSIDREDGFDPESLRFNCVTQDNIPLDSSIIGIDSVRLPADGRVPVFRKGDMVVIGNRIKQELGSAFTGGQTVQLDRRNCDRICLVDAKGKHVLAEKYSYNLADGTITFAEPLDLSDYTYPLTAAMAWEEENRITGVDISGRLKLQFAVSRDYPQESTYVSSALVSGLGITRGQTKYAETPFLRGSTLKTTPSSSLVTERLPNAG